MSYSSIVKAKSTSVYYAQINSDDPNTSISNSQGSTAQATIPIVQGDKIKLRFYLTEYNYETGVITHGISLPNADDLKGEIRTSSDSADLVAEQTFTKTVESAEKKQSYFISFSKDINNLAGKYFTLGRRTAGDFEIDTSLSPQSVTTTVGSTLMTQTNTVPVSNDDVIKFTYNSNGSGNGITPFATQADFYYVVGITGPSTTFEVSATKGGSAIAANSASTSTYQLYNSYSRDDERIDAFWFNDTGGTKTTTAPSIAYNASRVDINTTVAPTNAADYPSAKMGNLIGDMDGFELETTTNSHAIIKSTKAGRVDHIPTTSDASNIGISVQQYGADSICYYEATFDTAAQAAAISTALGTANSFTAKLVLKINEGSFIKTIAQQDVTIHRDFS